MGRIRLILAVAVLMGFAGGSASQAGGMSSRAGTRMLHLKFARVMRAGVAALVASKQYMLVVLKNGGYRVFDDANGRSWRVDTRPCGTASPPTGPPYGPGMFGAPWVLFYCSQGGFALYNVIHRRWRPIGASRTVGQAFQDAAGYPSEVGADWIKLTYAGGQDCGDHIHFGCGVTYSFYNIRSRTFPSGHAMSGNSVLDLDSQSLLRPLCEPLHAPPTGLQGPMGILALYGKVALEFKPYDPLFLNNAAPEQSSGQWTLQRCRSTSSLSVDPPNRNHVLGALTANYRAVLWSVIDSRGTWKGEIAGRFLPTLQPIGASLPKELADDKSGPVLDSSHIYVLTRRGVLWRAPFPSTH
jgi:hypothetical protein